MIEKHGKFLKGGIGSTLLRESIPMLFGMMALMTFNLVDAYYIGKLGTRHLAAMGFTFPIVMIIISVGIGIGTGSSSVISRAIGQGDHDKVKRVTTDMLLLSMAVSVVVSFFGILTIRPVFELLGASKDLLPLISQYMTIWYAGMIVIIFPMVANHAIRATGDMLFPALVMMLSAFLNVILDPIFIFGYFGFPRMEMAGAALATLISRSVTLFAAFYILHYRQHLLVWYGISMKKVFASWREIMHVGIPATFVNLLVSFSVAVVTRLIAGYGDTVVAAYSVAYRIEAFFFHIYLALCSVLAPFTGQNWGGRAYERVRQALSLSFKFSWGLGLVAAILLAWLGAPIMRIFNDNPEVIKIGQMYFWIVPISYGAEGTIMFSSTVFNALGKPLTSLTMVAMRTMIILIPLALLGRYQFEKIGMGYAGVFIAVAMTNFLVSTGVHHWNRHFFASSSHS